MKKEANFIYAKDFQLGKDGGLGTTLNGIPHSRNLKSLVVEMEYRDPNGEIKTSRSQKTIFPSETIVGIKTDSWMATPGKVNASGVITNSKGQPLAHRPYTVEAFLRESITHRKRLVGGFYAYDSKTKTSALGVVCKGTSDELGRFQCEGGKLPAGSLILQAKTEDKKHHVTYASVGVSVYADSGEQWWTPSDSDRIDIIPEKTKYEPNQSARIAVRSPFPKSTLLITVEREGVLEAFTKEITREQFYHRSSVERKLRTQRFHFGPRSTGT